MSDTPRDQGRDPDSEHAGPDDAVEPTTGPPAGAAASGPAARGSVAAGSGAGGSVAAGSGAAGSGAAGSGAAGSVAAGSVAAGATSPASGTAPQAANGPQAGASSAADPSSPRFRTGKATPGRTRAARLSPAGPETDARERRRRRWLVAGISVGAALLVIAFCAGGLAVISNIADLRGDAADAREDRSLHDAACLELEQRLNRLTPPGATTSPQARATAVRDENAAARIYVTRMQDGWTADGWRQLVDARTAYAEGLDAQAKSRTPAFFVAPRTGDGRAVADELVQTSPQACAGPIRRLAAPDL